MRKHNDKVFSLFIGDLSKFCNEAELERLFSTFGPVLDVKIKRNNNTGKTLSYGFVTFADESSASQAMEHLDETMFFGRRLRIRWAMYNARSQNPINETVINSVYVRFSTPRLDKFVTEEDLHSVFDKFGCVVDVSIKESSTDKRGGHRQSGYGFVHFSCDKAGIEAAFQAVQNVDNGTFNGVIYNVELSKNLLKQFKEMQMQQGGSISDAHAGEGPPSEQPQYINIATDSSMKGNGSGMDRSRNAHNHSRGHSNHERKSNHMQHIPPNDQHRNSSHGLNHSSHGLNHSSHGLNHSSHSINSHSSHGLNHSHNSINNHSHNSISNHSHHSINNHSHNSVSNHSSNGLNHSSNGLNHSSHSINNHSHHTISNHIHHSNNNHSHNSVSNHSSNGLNHSSNGLNHSSHSINNHSHHSISNHIHHSINNHSHNSVSNHSSNGLNHSSHSINNHSHHSVSNHSSNGLNHSSNGLNHSSHSNGHHSNQNSFNNQSTSTHSHPNGQISQHSGHSSHNYDSQAGGSADLQTSPAMHMVGDGSHIAPSLGQGHGQGQGQSIAHNGHGGHGQYAHKHPNNSGTGLEVFPPGQSSFNHYVHYEGRMKGQGSNTDTDSSDGYSGSGSGSIQGPEQEHTHPLAIFTSLDGSHSSQHSQHSHHSGLHPSVSPPPPVSTHAPPGQGPPGLSQLLSPSPVLSTHLRPHEAHTLTANSVLADSGSVSDEAMPPNYDGSAHGSIHGSSHGGSHSPHQSSRLMQPSMDRSLDPIMAGVAGVSLSDGNGHGQGHRPYYPPTYNNYSQPLQDRPANDKNDDQFFRPRTAPIILHGEREATAGGAEAFERARQYRLSKGSSGTSSYNRGGRDRESPRPPHHQSHSLQHMHSNTSTHSSYTMHSNRSAHSAGSNSPPLIPTKFNHQELCDQDSLPFHQPEPNTHHPHTDLPTHHSSHAHTDAHPTNPVVGSVIPQLRTTCGGGRLEASEGMGAIIPPMPLAGLWKDTDASQMHRRAV